jgi:hypothetical protein
MKARPRDRDRRSPAAPPRVLPPVDRAPAPAHRLAVAVLLILGIAAAVAWYGPLGIVFLSLGPWGPSALVAFAAAVATAVAITPVAAALSATIRRFDDLVSRHRTLAAVFAAGATLAFLYATARGRPLRPYVHDEFSYLIQAHQFARGHGWMPPHPLGPFFDSFQLLVDPVYASAYFPGTALMYVPGVWLHVPPWVTSLLVAGTVAGLLFRVAAELVDEPAAAVALLLLWTVGPYRTLSVMTLAQMPLLMWGLAATVSWLNWRSARSPGWAAILGACVGLAAITRPVDALCFAGPIAVDVLICAVTWGPGGTAANVGRALKSLAPSRFAEVTPPGAGRDDASDSKAARASPTPSGSRAGPVRRGTPRLSLALMVAAAVPSLLFQLILDHGITGHWTRTPFRLYADRDYPGTSYGFHPYDPTARPLSPLPQKQALYDQYRPVIADHTPASALDNLFRSHGNGGLSPARLELTLVPLTNLPLPMLLPLIPVALAGLTRRRAVVLAVVPLFVGLYFGYVFFFPHYTVTTAAAVVLAVVIGGEQLPLLLPSLGRRRAALGVPLLLGGLAVAGLPQFDVGGGDDVFPAPLIEDVNRQLAGLGHHRAVVLFRYDPHRNTNEEPVYNADVAWPDDAAVVRAHDLGPARDAALFAYYAARQPDRFVYRYDEASRTLTPLGPVGALAAPGTPRP